ncbi:MAG: hypothetical protein LC130_28680, partial [Bryobacterales bacterium]|nr:hypothetical protein [Bryobacterales bacterium]
RRRPCRQRLAHLGERGLCVSGHAASLALSMASAILYAYCTNVPSSLAGGCVARIPCIAFAAK